MMLVSIDSEFMEDGKRIELLSLALVKPSGEYLYLVNKDADYSHANEFVRDNVLPRLHLNNKNTKLVKHNAMGVYILNFLSNPVTGKVFNDLEFFGYYADYDWVAFCQIFGTMMDLPEAFPQFCLDIKQDCNRLRKKAVELKRYDLLVERKPGKYDILLPSQDVEEEHNALFDAWWNWKAYNYLQNIERELTR